MRKYPAPVAYAYPEITPEGITYHCYNLECFADNAKLREIDRVEYGTSYTPILRCSECGKTYYGLRTSDTTAEEEEITKYAEQERTAEEERAQLAMQANEEALNEIERLEAEQEQALREEVNEHASELAGDLTLPNIIGEQPKKTTRPDDEGDIILPNILTL